MTAIAESSNHTHAVLTEIVLMDVIAVKPGVQADAALALFKTITWNTGDINEPSHPDHALSCILAPKY